jgi:hypothetical protein
MGKINSIMALLRAVVLSFVTDLKQNTETSVSMYKITRCYKPDKPESETSSSIILIYQLTTENQIKFNLFLKVIIVFYH